MHAPVLPWQEGAPSSENEDDVVQSPFFFFVCDTFPRIRSARQCLESSRTQDGY